MLGFIHSLLFTRKQKHGRFIEVIFFVFDSSVMSGEFLLIALHAVVSFSHKRRCSLKTFSMEISFHLRDD